MHPDSGIIIRSTNRTLTREILPPEMIYPFDKRTIIDGEELVYWRKSYGICNAILNYCKKNNIPKNEGTNDYILKKENIFDLVEIVLHFMDRDTWNKEGDSIWTYDEVLSYLRKILNNLLVIKKFMEHNPDIYLVFYY